MKNVLGDETLDQLFRQGRTYSAWLDKPVTDDMLHRVYELMKWGPTSANGNPARFVFLRSREAKDRLRPTLAPGNVGKTMTAPVTVIIAYDLLFYEKFPKLFPTIPQCAASLPRIRNSLR
jgi:3-hydroxypropanoate dehydrogenase